MLKVNPKETVSLLTRDGVRLDADLYRPDAEGPFPILLMRQPYGRAIASTVVYAHPTWYAAHGYIVVIQDVRGRGTSEGEFSLFANEIEDGIDTVNWAANLSGSTGQVGMYGFSYQGMTQLYAASAQPTALKTICPAMIGYNLYADWAYEGGAFCLQSNLSWAIQLATESARLNNDAVAYQILYTASRDLAFCELDSRLLECLRKYVPDRYYDKWLKHSEPGEYWDRLSPNLANIDLPMLHIGGWFDTYLRGTLRLYRDMASRSAYPQHLIVGPWAHLPWGRKVGSVDYTLAASNPIDRLQIRWFDCFLKGIETGLLDESPISLFEMGSNQWRQFDRWPSRPVKAYFLASTGLASMKEDAGTLVETCSDRAVEDTFVHDPWRPVPSLGGHAAIPAGSFDRSHLDCRTDVLTYTSAPLTEDLLIIGEVAVELFCVADAVSFDICAVLSEVKANGTVYNFTQGYLRVQSKEQPITLSLQATYTKIATGNALRLSLSAACFPAYDLNPGTGLLSHEVPMMDTKIITVTVRIGEKYQSQIKLNQL